MRPAVISDDTRQALDEHRGFRRVVRNIYAFDFDTLQVRRLGERAPGVFAQTCAELLAFADFLERHARE